MGFVRLAVLSSLMLTSTLVASFLPLHLDLSRRKLSLVSTYSNGLLIGSALSVVIPEGVNAVYQSSAGEHDHEDGASSWIGASLLAGFILMYFIDTIHTHSQDSRHASRTSSRSRARIHSARSHPQHPSLRHMPSHLSELEPLSPPRTSTDHDLDPSASSPERSASPSPSDWTIPMSDYSHMSGSNQPPARARSHAHDTSVSTLIGLLLHSLSDGISLGASSASSSRGGDEGNLSSVVFLAIMLHKAPTAFALSNVLLNSPSPPTKSFIRRSLVLFSVSAPLGAIATYLVLRLLVGGGGQGLEWYTGVTLVFSGGTFLFVATSHVASSSTEDQHASTGGGHETGGPDGDDVDEGGTVSVAVSQRLQLALVLAGMVTPALLSRLVGHGHGHGH